MITDWADRPLSYFANKIGMPVSEYVPQTVGEYYGTGIEVVSDLFTKDWFNWFVKSATGLLAGGAILWGNVKNQRLKDELVPISNHLLARLLTLNPAEIRNIQTSFATSWAALMRGDMNGFLASISRSPTEFMAYFGVMPRAQLPPIRNGNGTTISVSTGRPITQTQPLPRSVDVEAPMGNHSRGRYTLTS